MLARIPRSTGGHRPGHLVLATLLLAAAPPLLAQQPPDGKLFDSQQRAVEVVRRGAEAHGGIATLRSLAGLRYHWAGVTFERDQGRTAALAYTPRPPSRAVSVRAVVDLSRGRWLTEFNLDAPGEGVVRSRSVLDGRQVLRYDPSAEGREALFSRDSLPAGAPAPFPFQGNLMPPLLVRQALARATTLRHLGERGEPGHVQDVVSVTNPDGTMLTLSFDRATGRLMELNTLGDHALLGDMVHAWRFADYRPVGGILIPYVMEHHTNGWIQEEMRLADVAVNPPLSDTLFAVPADYLPRQSAAAVPEVVTVAEGVHFAERVSGYRSLFVDTDEGVVVLEAPVSPRVTEQVIARIEKTLPGRPIRYVVLTHHHHDHVGGLAAYVARGATILIPPGTEDYLRRMLAAPRTLGVWSTASASTPTAPTLETVTSKRTIGSGSRAVEVIHAGETSHASSMLVAYLPAQQLLFQGDLLRIDEQSGPIRGTTAAVDLSEIIHRLGLEPQTIAGAHGRIGTMADLREALDPRVMSDKPRRNFSETGGDRGTRKNTHLRVLPEDVRTADADLVGQN